MGKLIVATGSKGAGKTTALATMIPPDEMDRAFVIDTENGWNDILQYAKPGFYASIYERFGLDDQLMHKIAVGDIPWASKQRSSMADLFDWFVGTMDKQLVTGRYKYVIIDAVEPIEQAITAAIDQGKMKYGWAGSKAYGRMETEGVRPLYEHMVQAMYDRGVEVVGLSTHVKHVWADDRPILNKVKPGGRLAVLTRLSSLMLWLVPTQENEDGAPAALVLKARMGKMTAGKDGWKVQRVLPRRIPHFSWQDVAKYDQYPANLASPAPGETPSQAEVEMISELLTDEQMKLMVLGAEIEREMVKQNAPVSLLDQTLSDEQIGQVTALFGQGVPLPMIAKRVDVPLAKVRELVANEEEVNFGM